MSVNDPSILGEPILATRFVSTTVFTLTDGRD